MIDPVDNAYRVEAIAEAFGLYVTNYGTRLNKSRGVYRDIPMGASDDEVRAVAEDLIGGL